ncbi:MAG TPA: MFS transporter [Burkholderiales bacterium]|nr:MFS transporter [Burkholderiales bacterium]
MKDDTGGAESRVRGSAWITPLAVTFAIQTLVAVAMYCAPVIAPAAVRDLGVSPSAIGWFIATAYLGSMIGSASAAGWMARVGPIRMSQIGLLACLVGLALAASAMLPLVLLGAFVIGLGYGPTTPASSLILVRATPPSRIALTFSIKQTGVPAGGAIAGALVPALILAFGWRASALAIGVGCLALALAIEPWRTRYDYGLNPKASISMQAILAPIALVVRDLRLRQMAVASFVYGGVQITLVTYLVTFVVDRFGLTLVLAGLVMSVSQVASIAGRILWGLLADRLFKRRTMLGLLGLGMGLAAIATLASGPDWPNGLIFVFASIFGATAVGWNGVYLAEVARLAPAGRVGEATGGCLFFTFLGVVVTPPVFNATLALSANYAVAYAVFGVPALMIGVWLLFARSGSDLRFAK